MTIETQTTIAGRLAAFATGLDLADVPPEVLARAKSCLIHGLVVGAAGGRAGFGAVAEQAAWLEGGGSAHLLTSGAPAPAALAAFINGAALHARAQEDTHGTFHSGVVTIPAALAATEAVGADGRTFLAAVIAGYEVGTALSDPLTDLTTPPFRATGVFGPLSAAAAAGRALDLTKDQMASALSLAAAFAGGTSEAFAAGSDEWHYQSGTAAATGLLAARLAQAGATGSSRAFEGPAGYLECFAGESVAADDIATDLGVHWRLLEVTYKPYPVCAFNQTPAMLAARLADEHDLKPADVERLVVGMNVREATYPGVPDRGPFNQVTQTLMSAPFGIAAAFAEKHVSYATLERFEDPDILGLIERIEIVPEPDRPPKTARATLQLRDGRTIEDAIEDSLPLLAWDLEGVLDNARRLLPETQLNQATLTQLVKAVEGLDTTSRPADVLAALLDTGSPAA